MIDHSDIISCLEKYHGLLNVQPKFTIKDQNILSIAYTPGVAACAKKIKENLQEIYNLTNKGKAFLLIGLGEQDSQGKINLSALPKLETYAVFYKHFFDIDAYPLILHPELANKNEELVEIIYNLSTAYSGFELFGFEGTKFAKIMDLCQREYIDAIIAEPKTREILEEGLEKSLTEREMKKNILVGSIIKASLELKMIQLVTTDTIQCFVNQIQQDGRIFKTDDLFSIARIGVLFAARALITTGLVKHKIAQPEAIAKKLEIFHYGLNKAIIEKKDDDYSGPCIDYNSRSLKLHSCYNGVLQAGCKIAIKDAHLFKVLFSKEVLSPLSKKIQENTTFASECTCKKSLIAVVTNGTAVLGLGNTGPESSLPVMEGKCILFKTFGDVDAIPICLKEVTAEKVIRIISNLSCGLAGINLEDISAPLCFEIEQELASKLDIPVFHDDQHGTAIVVAAGLLNSLKVCKKKIEDIKVVVNGAGAAGIAITELLLQLNCKNILICDTKGIIYSGRKENMNKYKADYAEKTNPYKITGNLKEALKDADVFIGVSVADCLKQEWISDMKNDPIIFALANPVPEIMPDRAKAAGARIVASGRSDLGNQLNNVLAFPGIFRGLIDVQACKISTNMKIKAALAIAELIKEEDLAEDHIIPSIFNPMLMERVAKAVMQAAMDENLAKKKLDLEAAEICKSCFQFQNRSLEPNSKDLEIKPAKSEQIFKS